MYKQILHFIPLELNIKSISNNRQEKFKIFKQPFATNFKLAVEVFNRINYVWDFIEKPILKVSLNL